MNKLKNVLVAAGLTGGVITLYYMARKKMKNGAQHPQSVPPRSRHLTGLFAKAKQG